MKSAFPVVLAFTSRVMQKEQGEPGLGLALQLLLSDDTGRETIANLQLASEHVWDVQDACADVAPMHYGDFMAFTERMADLERATDKALFLKSLPPSDAFPRFFRRIDSLSIPHAYLVGLSDATTGKLKKSEECGQALDFTFSMDSGMPLSFSMPFDLVFILTAAIGDAVWAAEWKRMNWLD